MTEEYPILTVKDLHFTWPNGVKALQGIGFTVMQNEPVALVGPNGAGKSTTLLAVLGFLKPEKGEILVKGIPVVPRNYKKIRALIGAVFQDPDDQLFMPTLEEDIAFGPLNMGFSKEETREKVEKALKTVGLEGMGSRSPHELSGGE